MPAVYLHVFADMRERLADFGFGRAEAFDELIVTKNNFAGSAVEHIYEHIHDV
jgi:uncharacterized UBP type Zn finger protein